ncbi:MAG: response regulator [Bryobacterales bacterium]|nr:response regulator [Acidobacteriota bacterium]MCB9384747.1 response regulator [Bryobacterales bacterium]
MAHLSAAVESGIRKENRPAAPVAAEPKEEEEDAACFICEKYAQPQDGFCSSCRAIVDLKLLELAPRHEGADRGQLAAALDRVREKIADDPSTKHFVQAALVCLNLRQSQQALGYLREACRLRPHDHQLVGYYDQLEKRPLILAVDDSKTVQKMISTVLEKESYRVLQAEDGLSAIAKLDEEMPALILLDITMPRMDGYQVCKVITGNAATKHIPVIMLSGKDGFFDKVRGKMVGASNYITKPFDPNELTKTIGKFLKKD